MKAWYLEKWSPCNVVVGHSGMTTNTVADMEFSHSELLEKLYVLWVPARAEAEFIKSSEPRRL